MLTLTSRTRDMVLIFKSNYRTLWQNVRIGFNLTVTAVPAVLDLAASSEDVTDRREIDV